MYSQTRKKHLITKGILIIAALFLGFVALMDFAPDTQRVEKKIAYRDIR